MEGTHVKERSVKRGVVRPSRQPERVQGTKPAASPWSSVRTQRAPLTSLPRTRRVLRGTFVGIVGVVLVVVLFLFLGWLQPTMNGAERLAIGEIFKVSLTPQVSRQPPPPPPQKEETPKAKPKRMPKPQAAERPVEPRTKVRQSVKPPSIAPEIAPTVGAGMGGLMLAVGTGGGGSLDFSYSTAVEETLADAIDQVRYEEFVEDAARRSMDELEREMKSQGMSSAQEAIPRYLPKPKYPYAAKKEGISGAVVIRVKISPEGRVLEHKVIAADPEGYFEEAIAEVLPQAEFEPAVDEQGRPIVAVKTFTYEFVLRDA